MGRRKNTILVCMNDKDHSRVAMHFACAKAKDSGASVMLVSVIDPFDYNTFFSVADVIKGDRIAMARQLLRDAALDAKDNYGLEVQTAVREGLLKDAIVHLIQEDESINLLMLGVSSDGSSSKSGLLPQLADAIGNHFAIPLMIIPGNLSDKQIELLI